MNTKQAEKIPKKVTIPNPFAMMASAMLAPVIVAEISRAKQYLGERLEEEQRQQLLKQSPQQLLNEAQLAAAAVYLRQQTEAAEATRRIIVKQEFESSPSKGPVS